MNTPIDVPEIPRDWKAEARGLGYMIRQIESHYRLSKALGGDSELLAMSIEQANAYVDGPLREALDGEPRRG